METRHAVLALFFAVAVPLLHPAAARGQDWTITGLGIFGRTQDLAADASGGVHILWSDRSSAYYGMIEESSLAFSETIPDSGDVTIRFTRPRLVVSADGSSVHTAWVTPDPTSDTMVHAWRDEGGAWHTEVVWTRTGTEHLAQPSICVLQDGSVHIIAQRWTEGVRPSPIVHYVKPAGGPWEEAVEISPSDDGELRDTAMVADAGDGIHAVWKAANRAGTYRFKPFGEPWDPAVEIPKRDGVATVSFGDLFVDAGGVVHHAFATFDTLTVDYAFKTPDGPFSVSVSASDGAVNAPGYDFWPGIAVDRLGRVTIVWAEQGGTDAVNRVMYARLEAGSWSRGEITADADVHIFGKPSIAVTSETLYVAWRGAGEQIMLLTETVEEPLPEETGPDVTPDAPADTAGDAPADAAETPAEPSTEPPPDAGADAEPGAAATGGCGCALAGG
jgi:hypothetical protein